MSPHSFHYSDTLSSHITTPIQVDSGTQTGVRLGAKVEGQQRIPPERLPASDQQGSKKLRQRTRARRDTHRKGYVRSQRRQRCEKNPGTDVCAERLGRDDFCPRRVERV